MFRWCSALESIDIPDSVTSIGVDAFEGCDKLKSIVIPDNVTIIMEYAFSSCDELEEVVIPAGIQKMYGHMFAGCHKLKEIKYKGTVEQWKNIFDDYGSTNPYSSMNKLFGGTGVERIICSDGVIEL